MSKPRGSCWGVFSDDFGGKPYLLRKDSNSWAYYEDWEMENMSVKEYRKNVTNDY